MTVRGAIFLFMTTDATNLADYLTSLPTDRVPAIQGLVDLARVALLPGCQETVGYVGVNYLVPLSRFPAGYHCTPGQPLPFVTIASQVRHIAVYHMGIYADPELLAWFQQAYADADLGRLDMGKSCIRFSNPAKIPFAVMGELFRRMDADGWVELYRKLRP